MKVTALRHARYPAGFNLQSLKYGTALCFRKLTLTVDVRKGINRARKLEVMQAHINTD